MSATDTIQSGLGPLIGHAEAVADLEHAIKDDRMHHGWMFSGPRGIGKARLALLFATAILSGRKTLEYVLDDKTTHLIETGAHPDFKLIARPFDDKGKQKTEIPVESIRKLSHFYSLRPAMGGWRVAVIDSMDELNKSSANALLKTLEEPPGKSLLILLSHGEAPILPTLKSRCRKLRLEPLEEAAAVKVLAANGVSTADARSLLSLAPGRPGRALAMTDKLVRDAAAAMRRAVNSDAGAKAVSTAMSTASRSPDAFDAAFALICDEARQAANSSENAIQAGDWARLYTELQTLGAETRGLNMDKSQAVASAVLLFQKQRRAG